MIIKCFLEAATHYSLIVCDLKHYTPRTLNYSEKDRDMKS